MITIDTSVAVPFLAAWHENHALVRDALRGVDVRLAAHVGVETYSVLSRLPGSRRVSPPDARLLLHSGFGRSWLGLPAAGTLRLLDRLAGAGVGGGSVYDAIVGATAVHHGARLLSLDERARPVYELLNVDLALLA